MDFVLPAVIGERFFVIPVQIPHLQIGLQDGPDAVLAYGRIVVAFIIGKIGMCCIAAGHDAAVAVIRHILDLWRDVLQLHGFLRSVVNIRAAVVPAHRGYIDIRLADLPPSGDGIHLVVVVQILDAELGPHRIHARLRTGITLIEYADALGNAIQRYAMLTAVIDQAAFGPVCL